MIIAISGAQGQGKSTLISELKKLGVFTIENKTARSILAEDGITLDEVYKSPTLTVEFQNKILDRHIETIQKVKESPYIHLIERSFADIFAYGALRLGAINEYSSWVNDYYIKCKLSQTTLINKIIYLMGREYTPSDDGVRSVNRHYMRFVDHAVLYTSHSFSPDSVFEVNSASLDERIKITMDKIKEYAKE